MQNVHPTTANGLRAEANSKLEIINTGDSAGMDVSSGFAFMSTLASLTGL